jgi:hypothetical protein
MKTELGDGVVCIQIIHHTCEEIARTQLANTRMPCDGARRTGPRGTDISILDSSRQRSAEREFPSQDQ